MKQMNILYYYLKQDWAYFSVHDRNIWILKFDENLKSDLKSLYKTFKNSFL